MIFISIHMALMEHAPFHQVTGDTLPAATVASSE